MLANSSRDTSPSIEDRRVVFSFICDKLRSRGKPKYSAKAITKGVAPTNLCNKAAVHSHANASRPSCSCRSFSSEVRYFWPSRFLANSCSSLEVRSLTLPISLRYILTGSSKTSRVSVSGSHSASSFSSSGGALDGGERLRLDSGGPRRRLPERCTRACS